MSLQGYPPAPSGPEPAGGIVYPEEPYIVRRPRRRYWLHAALLVLTLFTTTAVGAHMAENFRLNRPAIELDRVLSGFLYLWHTPSAFLAGLPFSLSLMTILLAHELGHYITCLYYRVDASLPYFIPAPTFIGTLGAFIRIRSPFFSRRVLFDVGIAGPLAGFVFLLPFLAIGLAFSKVIPGIGHRGDVLFGTPPVLWLLEKAIFPGVAVADISLHPVARAAWVGIFATALNLLPIGQLDGGHILYAFVGDRHRLLSRVFAISLVPMGFLWPVWWLWAFVLFLFGTRHPAVFDSALMTPARRKLGLVALLIFVLSFTPIPTSS